VRERDIRKENALRKQGWQVVRINADRIRNKNQFAEDVTDLALEIERIGNEYFADLCSRSELAVVQ
jgi:very-short-patch-repair endonuclease